MYGVNPNTIQKALSEMEMSHLLRAEGPNGRFITENNELIDTVKNQTIVKMVKEFVNQMKQVGLNIEDTMKLIQEVREGESNE